jgi:hypothetical protein
MAVVGDHGLRGHVGAVDEELTAAVSIPLPTSP